MCGIAGAISYLDLSFLKKNLKKVMVNRGPDNFNYFSNKIYNSKFINLFFSRLSILDFNSRSNQPFKKYNKVIIHNGEIYNYVELKKELSKFYDFETTSDTEVLITAYHHYGIKFVEYLEGMWAFAIYDLNNNKLILSRDRFGEKPLYYIKNKDEFLFGSEISYLKTLKNNKIDFNEKKIINFLSFGYRLTYSSDKTFYKDIFTFPKGEIWSLDLKTNKCDKKKYWNLIYEPNSKLTYNQVVSETEELLIKSIELRLRSDAKVAVSLSGGIDSGLIASIISKHFKKEIDTFSIIDDDERYNEYDNIKSILGSSNYGKSYFVKLDSRSFLQNLTELVEYHHSPVLTITSYINSILAKKIGETNNRVILSGMAGDEMFLGYYSHYLYWLYEMKNDYNFNKYLDEWEKGTGSFVENPLIKNVEKFIQNPNTSHLFTDTDVFVSLLNEKTDNPHKDIVYTDSSLRNRLLNDLFKDVIPITLSQEDLNYMKNSVENRCPFMDSKLAKYAYEIPNKFLIRNGYTKSILREIGKNFLPNQVNFDLRKKGFNASILSLFNLHKKENIEFCLDQDKIFEFVNKSKFEKFIKDSEFNSNSLSKFLFTFLSTKIFLNQN